MRKIRFIVLILLLFLFAGPAQANDIYFDLGITPADISFSDQLIEGQQLRIYAGISNNGTEDVSAYVTFYQGAILIGDSQVVSARAGGFQDEVYVDWTVPSGSFNIRAEINGQQPDDQNPDNDVAITSLYVPKKDFDKDGIPDDDDNDDDNDGLDDINEVINGTDPFDEDTDDDSCIDSQDDLPLNPDECDDNDNDGIGDNLDNDDDNDNVPDDQDPDPFDPNITNIVNEYPPQYQDNQNENNDNNDDNTNNNDQENEQTDDIEQVLGEKIENDEFKIAYENQDLKTKLVIETERINWNTYKFKAVIKGANKEELVYKWDFDDGFESQQAEAEHQFSKPGEYKVTLNARTNNSSVNLKSHENIKISFFNTANPMVWAVFGSLLFVLFLLFLILTRKKRQED